MIQLSEYRSDDTNMILADVQIIANTLMFEHGLLDQGWFFNFDRARKRFGLCKHGEHVISMSKYFTPLRTFAENKNTILHEIAHALVGPGNGHNEVWRAKAIEIGSDGERCGKVASGEKLDSRWTTACTFCGPLSLGFHRAPVRVRSCSDGHDSAVLEWFEFGDKKHWTEMPEKYQKEYYSLMSQYGENVLLGRVSTLDEVLDELEDNGWMDENE